MSCFEMNFDALSPDEVFEIMSRLPSPFDSLRLRAGCWPRFRDMPPSPGETELLEKMRNMSIKKSEALYRKEHIRLGVESIVTFLRDQRMEKEKAPGTKPRKAKRPRRGRWNGQAVTIKKMDNVVSSDFSDIGFKHAV